MNYTKEHHFPQWEKTDRVLMEDFNRMCQDMETGLNEANASAASADAAAEARALARLRKLGYDLCQTAARSAAAGASQGHAKGLVYNGLTTPEERAKTDGLYIPECDGMWLGPRTGLTLERLNEKITETQIGTTKSTGDKTSSWIKFHSVGRGVIQELQIWFHQNSTHYYTPNVTVRCYDVSASTYVYDSGEVKQEMTGAIGEIRRTVAVDIPIEAGHDYRLEMDMKASLFGGRTGIGTEETQSLAGTLVPTLYTGGTVSDSLRLESPASMALAVVHYTGGDAAPTAKIKDQAMTPAASRQTTSARGAACTEQEYFLEGSWSGDVSLSAAFQSTNNDLTIHDIEWYLI